jgi:ABC-type multidrug transport system fused ATPase/permease subunit
MARSLRHGRTFVIAHRFDHRTADQILVVNGEIVERSLAVDARRLVCCMSCGMGWAG